jgi:predicted Zn finger-like uncharacterized protein
MTSSNQQITRCPKCGTAFRITHTQLQSANGAVRCGSCLNVFKAMDYLVAPVVAKASSTAAKSSTVVKSSAAAPKGTDPQKVAEALKPVSKPSTRTPATITGPASASPATSATKQAAKPAELSAKPVATTLATKPGSNKPVSPLTAPGDSKQSEQLAILSSIKPLPVKSPTTQAKPTAQPAPQQKPVVRVLDKSSLDQVEDILISDDMEENKSETKSYEFDGFMDIDITPKAEVSLFERKIREQEDKQDLHNADESWAEMLIEEEDEEAPRFTAKPKSPTQDEEDFYATERIPEIGAPTTAGKTPATAPAPSLMFSLVGDPEPAPAKQSTAGKSLDDLVLSDELANIPDHEGFKPSPRAVTEDRIDPTIFETPDAAADDESPKRQVKTRPKIRAYDGSRTALLMNIIPAPIEFTAKRMRRWYQRKLWPALSLLALIALVTQLGWFKFDYFSRVEPYRTVYTFLCPHLGCEVPTLVDTSQISAFNLVVREHSETAGALAVDVMIMNNAPFDQPYPDLVLVFTDLDENEVASRRFSPREYLGGEAAGSSLMEQKRPVHLTLDLVDPGEQAVNYHIYIPHKQ